MLEAWPGISAMTADDYREAVRMKQRRHGKDNLGDDAILVFTTWDPDRENGLFHLREGDTFLKERGVVCQTALELNIVNGWSSTVSRAQISRMARK